MSSNIINAKLKLPIDFINELYDNFSERNAEKILLGMNEKRYTTLRANTSKYSSNQLEDFFINQKIEYQKVSWYNDAYILKNEDEKYVQTLEIYKNGYIYLQSLSSMIPPLILEPNENEKILDLAAAPGSKTTQMANMMNNKGYILANEIDKIRCERLKYNVQLQDAKIVEVNNEDGTLLGQKHENEFDKVLIDTPCSGEGRFIINDSKTYSNWSTTLRDELKKLQLKLIKSAILATKSLGTIVYSTCTLNKEENEKIIDYAIKNLNVEVVPIEMKFQNSIKGNNKGLDKSIEDTIKILPSKEMEGFYIVKLRKKS